MSRSLIITLLTVLMLMASACSNDEQFRVNGTIAGKPNMNLRVAYYADGAYQQGITAVRDGEFEFFGAAKQPTIVEFLDNDYRTLGRIYAMNGETFEVDIDRDKPYAIKIDGNDISKRWAKALNENAEALNRGGDNAKAAIEAYISANPEDIVSTLLLVTSYDASSNVLRADSLLTSIAVKARPSTITDPYSSLWQRLVSDDAQLTVEPFAYAKAGDDTLHSFMPRKNKLNLLAVSETTTYRVDSIVPTLRRLNKRVKKGSFGILDISVDIDSAEWRQGLEADTVRWASGWIPGNIAAKGIDRLALPTLPYFIVCDSTGRQLLRTPSIGRAEKFLHTRTK